MEPWQLYLSQMSDDTDKAAAKKMEVPAIAGVKGIMMGAGAADATKAVARTAKSAQAILEFMTDGWFGESGLG